MASMQTWVVKKLMNDIIDLKKNKGEGNKTFKPFMKKRTDSAPRIPPIYRINIEDYAMDNYCHTHHANHSKIAFPKFINFFTTLITPPDPPKREKRNERRKMKKTKMKMRNKKEKSLHPT